MTINHRCSCELLPLYVLDALSDEDRQWVDQQVAEVPDLAQELAEYQLAVATLPYSTPAISMTEDRHHQLKAELFDRLELAAPPAAPDSLPAPISPPSLTVRFQDLRWRPHSIPGVTIAILHADHRQREIVGLLRAEAGTHYPLHRHAAVEELYMLSGDLHFDAEAYGPGDYIRSCPGSTHALHTIAGCSFFFRTSMDDEYLE